LLLQEPDTTNREEMVQRVNGRQRDAHVSANALTCVSWRKVESLQLFQRTLLSSGLPYMKRLTVILQCWWFIQDLSGMRGWHLNLTCNCDNTENTKERLSYVSLLLPFEISVRLLGLSATVLLD